MGRLIDTADLNNSIMRSKYRFGMLSVPICNVFKDMINDTPTVKATVEAIPKDQYEARLKADMVAMLDRVGAEIDELYSYVEFDEDLKTSFNMIRLEEVQRVIDKYKAESEET